MDDAGTTRNLPCECEGQRLQPQKRLNAALRAHAAMVKKGPAQPSRASSGDGAASDDDAAASAPAHAQLGETLARIASADALVQSEALVSLHIFVSTVYTQGGGSSLPHLQILQAVVPLLAHASIQLQAHLVVAQILRTVADNGGEEVCDLLASSAAIPSVVANLVRALAAPSPDVCTLCSDYFFFLASLCDCRYLPLTPPLPLFPSPPPSPPPRLSAPQLPPLQAPPRSCSSCFKP